MRSFTGAALVTALVLVLGACGDDASPGGGPAAEATPGDFCAAAEGFSEAEARVLEQDESPEARRAAALASVEAYAALAASAPEEIRGEADTALEGQRGSFEALDRIGWGEDALSTADSGATDELLDELERYLGDEYLTAEEAVIEQVRAQCDPGFLGG